LSQDGRRREYRQKRDERKKDDRILKAYKEGVERWQQKERALREAKEREKVQKERAREEVRMLNES